MLRNRLLIGLLLLAVFFVPNYHPQPAKAQDYITVTSCDGLQAKLNQVWPGNIASILQCQLGANGGPTGNSANKVFVLVQFQPQYDGPGAPPVGFSRNTAAQWQLCAEGGPFVCADGGGHPGLINNRYNFSAIPPTVNGNWFADCGQGATDYFAAWQCQTTVNTGTETSVHQALLRFGWDIGANLYGRTNSPSNTVTLWWANSHTGTLSIDNGIGDVTNISGNTYTSTFSITASTTFTLTASGQISGTKTSSVTLNPFGVLSVTLGANPIHVSPGQTPGLSWTSLLATSLSIDNGIGTVPGPSGSKTTPPLTKTTTY